MSKTTYFHNFYFIFFLFLTCAPHPFDNIIPSSIPFRHKPKNMMRNTEHWNNGKKWENKKTRRKILLIFYLSFYFISWLIWFRFAVGSRVCSPIPSPLNLRSNVAANFGWVYEFNQFLCCLRSGSTSDRHTTSSFGGKKSQRQKTKKKENQPHARVESLWEVVDEEQQWPTKPNHLIKVDSFCVLQLFSVLFNWSIKQFCVFGFI